VNIRQYTDRAGDHENAGHGPALLIITLGLLGTSIPMGTEADVDSERAPRKILKPRPSKFDEFGNRIQ
jgi:hypothetical protein